MAAPATTLEPEKQLRVLFQQAPYNEQLVARVKNLHIWTQWARVLFSASTFIQCPLLLTLNVLMPSFCFRSCLLF